MKEVILPEKELKIAIKNGFDAIIETVVQAIYRAIDGKLNGETMTRLTTNQITLLAYHILREEVMDGGFVQLIHNGYGPFIFKNPFATILKKWGLEELAKVINKSHKLFSKFGNEITKDCSDDEFMSLFEQYPAFDDQDDVFVENEEQWSETVALFVCNNIGQFVKLTNNE